MKVAVVGAGWAGLAAALRLAEGGAQVTVFEAAPIAGGRARSASLATPLGRFTVDNGQHLVVGAYRDTLALVERLGAGAHLHRHRLALSSPSGVALRAAPLPAPLHLAWATLAARGLGPGARTGMLRLMAALRRAGWRALPAETVAGLLARHRQPAQLVARLWEPLCVGALNTLPAVACAGAFAAVLRDTLGGARGDSDFVTADAPLGALLPEPALARLAALGAQVRLRSPVRRLAHETDGWRVIGARHADGPSGETGAGDDASPGCRAVLDDRNGMHDIRPRGEGAPHDALLLALPPWSAAELLEASGVACEPLRAFEPEAIATAWAFWSGRDCPALPRWSLLDEDPARGRHGQWLFDRGLLPSEDRQREPARVAGVVISAASRLARLAPAAASAGVAAQLQDAFGGPPPAAMRLVTERRATFRCTPRRPRLAPDHLREGAPGLWLAGDWLWPDYPATLEAAVRSGQAAADAILGA